MVGTAYLSPEPGAAAFVSVGDKVAEDDVIAMTRKGKQVLNVKGDDEAAVCAPVAGDSVAVIGENRKLLLFPLEELPEMPRGKGVRLQRYRDGGLADAKTFSKKEGLIYIDAAKRSFTVAPADLRDWWGARAAAARATRWSVPPPRRHRAAGPGRGGPSDCPRRPYARSFGRRKVVWQRPTGSGMN